MHSSSKTTPWWLIPNLLSLDAPVIAVLWQGLFAQCYHILLPFSLYAALGISVWIIYVVDRLLDVHYATAPLSTPRHLFYKKYQKLFVLLTILACCLDLWIILTQIPAMIVYRGGAILFLIVLVHATYILSEKKEIPLLIPKEVFNGFIFAVGTALSTYVHVSHIAPSFHVEVIFFGALCSLNCLAISCWEGREGEVAVSNASAMPMIKKRLPLLLMILAGASLIFPFYNEQRNTQPFFLFIALSAFLLFLLDANQKRVSGNFSRVMADVALLSPLLSWLVL